MIRVERSPAFWAWVAEDEAVRDGVLKDMSIQAFIEFIQRPDVTPLASQSGGFLFRKMDDLGMVLELHTLFRREGWGREVAHAAKQAAAHVFTCGCRILYTHEQAGNWRSVPPKSHGWKRCCDDFMPSPIGDLRLWYLTPELWGASVVNRGKS